MYFIDESVCFFPVGVKNNCVHDPLLVYVEVSQEIANTFCKCHAGFNLLHDPVLDRRGLLHGHVGEGRQDYCCVA